MMNEADAGNAVLAARYSPRCRRFFGGYCRRLLRKRFAAVRLARGSAEVLSEVERHHGPAIIAMNHPSWWDPILGMVVGDRFFPGRPPTGPIESEQWRKFGFMKRLGLFGLDPSHPDAMGAMVGHVAGVFEREPRSVLGITPQGGFTDVRDEVRLRPGVAAIVSRLQGTAGVHSVLVVSLSLEYAFWNEPKAEVLLRAERVEPPAEASTTGWHRAISATMTRNAEELGTLVRARDAAAFEPLIATGRTQTNPVYDLWLRLRGFEPRIDAPPPDRKRGPSGAQP